MATSRPLAHSPKVALVAAFLSAGCVKTANSPTVGVSDSVPEEESAHPPDAAPKTIPDDIVLKSRVPFRVLKTNGNEALDIKEFFDELSTRDLICLGEQHDDPHHHWAQLYTIQEIAQRAQISGRELGLGLEMFQTPFQAELDEYAEEKIDASELLDKSEYQDRWGFPFAFYRHQMDHILARGGALVALNADRELSRRVASRGVDALTEKDLRGLGELDMNDAAHRARFETLMKDHPDTGMSHDNMYAAQVLWDETMASTAADWLKSRYPARQLVVLAGTAHCHQSGIPSRVERRLDVDAVGVRPLAASSENADGELEGYDYGLLLGD